MKNIVCTYGKSANDGRRRAYDFSMESRAAQMFRAEEEIASPGPISPPLHVQVAGHDLTIFIQSLPMIAAMVRDI